jgi:hypothetical protein
MRGPALLRAMSRLHSWAAGCFVQVKLLSRVIVSPLIVRLALEAGMKGGTSLMVGEVFKIIGS